MPLVSMLFLLGIYLCLLGVGIVCGVKRWKSGMAAVLLLGFVVIPLWWGAEKRIGAFEAGGTRIEVSLQPNDEGFVTARVSGRGGTKLKYDVVIGTGNPSKVQAYFSPATDTIWMPVAASASRAEVTVFDLRAGDLDSSLAKQPLPPDAVELPLLR